MLVILTEGCVSVKETIGKYPINIQKIYISMIDTY